MWENESTNLSPLDTLANMHNKTTRKMLEGSMDIRIQTVQSAWPYLVAKTII